MFGYSDDLLCVIDSDPTVANNDHIASPRKNSFIDLLSEHKPEQPMEDMQNFDALFNEDTAKDLHFTKSEPEQVQLLLDQFPYFNSYSIICSAAEFNQLYSQKLGNCENIGPLTKTERKRKVENYLRKKKQRSWEKKTKYDCRKKVAINRIRCKGRFVKRIKVHCAGCEEAKKKGETGIA
jgi:hypothetical protein